MIVVIIFFFFFQAEDGIRDLYVTGVQTCALPISVIEGLGEFAIGNLATAYENDRPHEAGRGAEDGQRCAAVTRRGAPSPPAGASTTATGASVAVFCAATGRMGAIICIGSGKIF